LFGTNPDRWRLQLRNAVQIYKTAGTKQSIQFAVNTVFPKDTYPVSSNIKELWESYIPYLIYYSLATESPYFESNQTWTPELARSLAIDTYAETIDENIRLAVDRIVLETYIAYPEDFRFPTDMGTYVYRGREYPIPPFEEYPWYVNTTLTESMVRFIADRLVCFGVPNSFALQLIDYVLEYLFY
jgi:hypothetical protein